MFNRCCVVARVALRSSNRTCNKPLVPARSLATDDADKKNDVVDNDDDDPDERKKHFPKFRFSRGSSVDTMEPFAYATNEQPSYAASTPTFGSTQTPGAAGRSVDPALVERLQQKDETLLSNMNKGWTTEIYAEDDPTMQATPADAMTKGPTMKKIVKRGAPLRVPGRLNEVQLSELLTLARNMPGENDEDEAAAAAAPADAVVGATAAVSAPKEKTHWNAQTLSRRFGISEARVQLLLDNFGVPVAYASPKKEYNGLVFGDWNVPTGANFIKLLGVESVGTRGSKGTAAIGAKNRENSNSKY
jgi:hypothetical protein